MGKKSFGTLNCFGLGLTIFFSLIMYGCDAMMLADLQVTKEAQKIAVPLPKPQIIDKAYDGKTVYLQGQLQVQGLLKDARFGIEEKGLILNYFIEYFQYDEESRRRKGIFTERKYYITTDWEYDPISTEDFENKVDNTLIFGSLKEGEVFPASVKLGAYNVGHDVLVNIDLDQKKFTPKLEISSQMLQNLHDTILTEAQKTGKFSQSVNAFYEDLKNDRNPGLLVHFDGNEIFFGRDKNNPLVGDMLLSFRVTPIPTEMLSCIVEVDDDTLHEFKDSSGFTSSEMLVLGKVSMQKILFGSEDTVGLVIWAWRIICALCLLLPVYMALPRIKATQGKQDNTVTKPSQGLFKKTILYTLGISCVAIAASHLTIWLW